MPEESGIILPPGVGQPVSDTNSHAVVINETGLPDDQIYQATETFFEEQASLGGIARAPSTFGVYSANQGSLLARTEYRTPSNVIEEIKLARELAERDDDIASVMQSMIAVAFGDGMENFHEDERTLSIYNSAAMEMNLDRVLREYYREYLISYQVNSVGLFTRTSLEYTMAGSDRLRSDLIAWPYSGVIHAENIRVIGNDMFGTGDLAYVPDNEAEREWLDEYFNPDTTPARKAEMGRKDRVMAAMFTGVYEVSQADMLSDADVLLCNGRLYKLNPRIVQRHTGAKGGWKYPRPLLTRNFALLEAKRLLNLMDFALLQGGANFIVVAKKGTDQRPAQPAELQNLQQVVRRASRTGVIVGDHRLDFDVITPELKELLNPEKRKLIGRKLARGLLRLPELDEEGGSEGTRLDAEFIARIIQNDRHEIKRHVERSIYREMAKRNPRRINRGAPKLWFPKIILQGSQYFNDLVLKLRDRGDIPRSWAVEAGGFDFEAGVQVRKREREANIDEVMAPAEVPFDSPNRGPQDNGPGRPANQPNGQDPARPRQVVQRTAGETITAMYDEDLERGVRIGENTLAILEEYPDYRLGRVSRIESDILAAEDPEPHQRATSIYVPVNPGHECADYQALNLADGLRLIVGDRRSDRAKVAKMVVFREAEFDEAAAESRVIRWGFPVRMPDETGDGPGGETALARGLGALAEAIAGQKPPEVHVEVTPQGATRKIIERDPETNEITGSREVPVDDGGH
jgi:hypothetical protein